MTVINPQYPPTGLQVTAGAGTLQGVQVPPPVGVTTGNAAIDVSFYDALFGTTVSTLTQLLALTPIAVVKTPNGYAPIGLNATYSHGLYAYVRSTSSIAVTHS
jgi:hypothetical protein